MTPMDYMLTLARFRDALARADARLHEAEITAGPVIDAFHEAAAAYDRADASGDPMMLDRVRESYGAARRARDDARERVERATAARAAASRDLGDHEGKAEEVFDGGADDLRREVNAARAELEGEWTKCASDLLATGRKIAALARTVPTFTVKSDPMALVSRPVPFGAGALERSVDATVVPKLGTGGLDGADRLVSREKITANIPTMFHDLAADHAALRQLANFLYQRGAARSAAE